MGGIVSVVAYCFDDEHQPNPNKALGRRKCKILGRGNNRDGHLSADDDRFAIEEWQRLIELEQALKGKATFDGLYVNYESTMLLNNAADIYAVGNNKHFKLGINDQSEDDTLYHLQQVPFDKETHGNPVVLSQGIHSSECSFVYTQSGRLFASGLNATGSFGNGSTDDMATAMTRIETMSWLGANEVIEEIHCGSSHSLFLTASSKLFGAGLAKCIGTEDDVLTPILLHEGIVMVATGTYHSLLVNWNNKLIIHGADSSPSQITEPGSRKKIESFFNDHDRAHLTMESVHSGFLHGMVLCLNQRTRKRELYTFGNNQHGQIGNGTVLSDPEVPVIDPHLVRFEDHRYDEVIQASAGRDHNVVMTNKNNVFAFGYNLNNKCGNRQWPPIENQAVPFLIEKEDAENGMGLGEGLHVELVMATNCATIIVVS